MGKPSVLSVDRLYVYQEMVKTVELVMCCFYCSGKNKIYMYKLQNKNCTNLMILCMLNAFLVKLFAFQTCSTQ